MANTDTLVLPLEWAVNIPMALFLLFQVISGVVALHLLIKAQGVKFQVNRLHPQLLQIRKRGHKDE